MPTRIGFDAWKARGAIGIDTARFREDEAMGVGIANFANEMTLYTLGDPKTSFSRTKPFLQGLVLRVVWHLNLVFFSLIMIWMVGRTFLLPTVIWRRRYIRSRKVSNTSNPLTCSGMPARILVVDFSKSPQRMLGTFQPSGRQGFGFRRL